MRLLTCGSVLLSMSLNASGAECNETDMRLSVQEQCLSDTGKKNERAIDILQPRLLTYQKKVKETGNKVSSDSMDRSIMVISAQKSLKKLGDQKKEIAELKKKIGEYTWQSKAAPPGQQSAENSDSARRLAEKYTARKQEIAAIRDTLDGFIEKLASASSEDAQHALLQDIKSTKKRLEDKESALKTTLDALVTAADEPIEPDMGIALARKAAKLYASSEAEIDKANHTMVEMQSAPGDPVDDATKSRRADFLEFLESHPLLESEVSGPGLQISTTSGDGKVVLKPEFFFGRTAQYWFAGSVSSPITKGSDGRMSAVKNSVLLDKLAGDTTIKGEWNYLNPFENKKSFWLIGGSAEAGYQEFSYLDPDQSFADPLVTKKIDSHATSYGLSAHAGFSPSDFNDLFLIRFVRQYSHKSQPTVSACPPMTPGQSYVRCSSGALGAPIGEKFNIVSAEWRHRFDSFAFSTVLSYDRTSKVRALAIPIYISLFNYGSGAFSSAVPKLSAGVQLGWRSDTKGSVGVFAGVPFTMIKAD